MDNYSTQILPKTSDEFTTAVAICHPAETWLQVLLKLNIFWKEKTSVFQCLTYLSRQLREAPSSSQGQWFLSEEDGLVWAR